MGDVPENTDGSTTFHDLYSNYVLKTYHEEIRDKLRYNIPHGGFPSTIFQGRGIYYTGAQGRKGAEAPHPAGPSALRVCIIGAGAAGLYAAMILQSLGVEYEILEAQPSHRDIGGRLLTHHFNDSPNDYYDIGAMRFPNILPMWRTFDLFHRLHFTGKYIWRKDDLKGMAIEAQVNKWENTNVLYNKYVKNVSFGNSPIKHETTDVIDYYFSTPKDLLHFNGITASREEVGEQGDIIFDPTIPLSYLSKGVQYWLDAKVGYFKETIKNNFASGMEALMAYDFNSVRRFMGSLHPELRVQFEEYMKVHYPNDKYMGEQAYPDEVINWIETFSMGTTMYDSAFSEIVLDELDFNYAPEVSWKAIQGGSERIALAMARRLREAHNPTGRILQNKRVKKISPVDIPDVEIGVSPKIFVHVEGEAKPRVYDHVLSTVSLSALRLIDLDDCNISWRLRESIRSLQYEASVKVGIRFTHRWWEAKGHDHVGGVTTTDRPSRMIVYPSYGIGSKDATMVASYSWSQDALRLGTLVKGQGSTAEQRLVDVVLQDMAKIHDIPFDDLKSWLVDAHAYNWYDNEYTMGQDLPFFSCNLEQALYGSLQVLSRFSGLLSSARCIKRWPAGLMRLHFAGEAASTTHAWVAGALDSSVRALQQIFYQHNRTDLIVRLKAEWGGTSEMTEESLKYQVALGQDAGETYGRVYSALTGAQVSGAT